MLTRKHFLSVITLGAPLLAGMVSEFFLYIADSAMVGRLGTNHLAAIAIATLYGEIMWVTVWPFAPGTQALAARRYGRLQAANDGDESVRMLLYRETGKILDNSVVVSLLGGLAAMLMAVFSDQVLNLLLDDQQLIPLAESYIRIIKYAMPLAAVFYSFYGFLAAVNLTRVIMVATVGLNILNILFNYVLIFGKFGFPALGIEGAAIGTVLAQSLGTAYIIGYVFVSKHTRVFWCFRFQGLRLNLIKDIFIASCPMIAQLGLVLAIIFYYETIIAFPFEIIFTHNGWGKFPLVTELFSIITFALGLTLLLTRYFNMGIYAAWLSLGLYMVCYSILLFGGFMSKRWLHITVEKATD